MRRKEQQVIAIEREKKRKKCRNPRRCAARYEARPVTHAA